MTKVQKILTDLLKEDCTLDSFILDPLDPVELAELFVNFAFLQSFLVFFTEQHWIENQKKELNFKEFISSFLKIEFAPMKFLHLFLTESSFENCKKHNIKSEKFEKNIIEKIKSSDFIAQKIFAKEALVLISKIFIFENELQISKKECSEYLSLSLYRTFDRLDEVFNLDYNADHGMKTDLNNHERLYEGAGIGVQSGYSNVLIANHYLNSPNGAAWIDLGSGYGRVGIAIGLLRPDIQFTGYEYVEHRVKIANETAKNFGLQNHVQFKTQDLSNFQIPDADVYYIYDPFSKETYEYVLQQLVEISKRKKITIITKGNARFKMEPIVAAQGWPLPREFDNGNLCLYSSR